MAKNKMVTFLVGLMLLAVLVIGVLYYLVFDKFEQPYFERIENIRIDQVKINKKLELTFIADLQFYNPSPLEVHVTGLYNEIFINKKKTTTINQKLDHNIPGNDQFTLPIQFNLPILDKGLLNNIGSLLSGSWKNKSIDLRSKGTITITVAKMDMDIPFQHQKEYMLSDYLED